MDVVEGKFLLMLLQILVVRQLPLRSNAVGDDDCCFIVPDDTNVEEII